MRRAIWIAALCTAALSSSVSAEEADVKQTIADLRSQMGDKQRFDKRGAAKLELSQAGGWLDEATNALKEEKAAKARRAIERVRAQLKLVDQLVARSELEAQKQKLDEELAKLKSDVAAKRATLTKKRAKIETLRAQTK